jgi:hypothetical protein
MGTAEVNAMIMDGLKYMGIGIGVVFVVILVFFVVIKLMMRIWPAK